MKKKIRVGIIDSGFSLKSNIAKDINFKCINCSDDFIGHGTGCILTIAENLKECGEDIEYFIYKIFENNLKASIFDLKNALKEMLKYKVSVIVLCLSLQKHDDEIEKLIFNIINNEIFVITSMSNYNFKNSLSKIPNVFYVHGSNNLSEKEVMRIEDRGFLASLNPRFIWLDDKRLRLYSGNSKATSIVAVKIIRSLILEKNVTESIKFMPIFHGKLNEERIMPFYGYSLFNSNINKIESIILQTVKKASLHQIRKYSIFNSKIKMDMNTLHILIDRLNAYFNVNLYEYDLYLKDLTSAGAIYEKIKYIKKLK